MISITVHIVIESFKILSLPVEKDYSLINNCKILYNNQQNILKFEGSMEMFVFSLFNTIVISFTMIGFGLLFMKKPPKEISSVFGYRTSMSSKNKDTWVFAHKYAGRVWFNSGIVKYYEVRIIELCE
ncbi:SdpI family protein [Haloimpatiens sp. FM7330]|uniref:SdpI family protein n=1 Tax=Haloimpatiens sp. FM7330 TaxID=3298610 RepID=UPI00364514BF